MYGLVLAFFFTSSLDCLMGFDPSSTRDPKEHFGPDGADEKLRRIGFSTGVRLLGKTGHFLFDSHSSRMRTGARADPFQGS